MRSAPRGPTAPVLSLLLLLGAHGCGQAGPAPAGPAKAAGAGVAPGTPKVVKVNKGALMAAKGEAAPAQHEVEGGVGQAAVGQPAPAFTVKDDTGAAVSLASHRGVRPVLLAFYPKDFTGGCTAELKDFAAKHQVFQDAGVQVYGVSIDPPQRHHEFRQSLGLPFPLLADEDGAVSEAYGALAEHLGQRYSLRKIVLIDRDGEVAYRDEGYKVGDPGAFKAMVEAMQALGAPDQAAAAG